MEKTASLKKKEIKNKLLSGGGVAARYKCHACKCGRRRDRRLTAWRALPGRIRPPTRREPVSVIFPVRYGTS